jgi:phage terminase large subunit-like protein
MVTENIIYISSFTEEFKDWNPQDGFKYEWYDGEIIKFEGMKRRNFTFTKLVRVFCREGSIK